MHNIHYIIVNADSPEAAMGTALMEIEDWGNENNWRDVIGAFDKQGTFYSADNDRMHFKGEYTLEETNELFTKRLSRPSDFSLLSDNDLKGMIKLMKSLNKILLDKDKFIEFFNEDEINYTNLYKFKRFADNIFQIGETTLNMDGRKTFDVFKDEYYPYCFDEVGVTSYGIGDQDDAYCVLIDMHS